MIAALQERQVDQSNRALSAGRDDGPVTFFQFANLCPEFERGGSTVQAIGVARLVLIPTVVDRSGVGK